MRVQVGSHFYGPSVATAAAPPPAPEKPPEPPTDEHKGGEGDDDTRETWARRIGSVGDALAKAPRALLFIPEFLKFAIFDAILPLVGVTAVMGGLVGTVAIGAAGVMEIVDGAKHKDPVVMLSGAGEMARGGFMGALTYDLFKGQADLAVGPLGLGFGLAHGALNLTSGAFKVRRGYRDDDREDKVVGWLEVGMGACAVATCAVPGGWKVPFVGLNGLLAASRTAYMNREKLAEWKDKLGDKSQLIWEKFKDLFRHEEEARESR